MALSAGTRLGSYEILEPLGAGGMGEVYRARDPRLQREVALEILPAELASEPERLMRFDREAQSLAALNHPHIVTIHSVEEAPCGAPGVSFSEIASSLRITTDIVVTGLVFAVVMGVVGGLLPALRVARLPITSALREA